MKLKIEIEYKEGAFYPYQAKINDNPEHKIATKNLQDFLFNMNYEIKNSLVNMTIKSKKKDKNNEN